MGFGDKSRNVVVALVACAATALLVFFGNGLVPRWPLMWVAPLPVLVYALKKPAWSAGLVAFVAMLAGCLNLWGYFRVLGAPPIAWVLNCGLIALVFAACVLLMRALARRSALWSAWFAFPAAWVTFEFVRNFLWPHGSAACLAYSQLNFLPFLQLASLAGAWGMSFVLMLFPAGIALGIHEWRSERGQAIRRLAATVGVMVAVLIFGAVRMAIRQPGPMVRVGLVASDIRGNAGVAEGGTGTERLLRDYGAEAKKLAARGAQVIVMPEKLGVVVDPETASDDAILQQVADGSRATVVAGVARVAGPVQYNEARVYTPRAAVASYDKHHMLPPFELRFKVGTSQLLLPVPEGLWGVEICKDMDFTEPSRWYGRAGAGLMLVPGWDFDVDGFWHGHIAVMRGVEDGFSVVRAPKNGLLMVSDDRGRIVAEVASGFYAPFSTLLTDVPAGHDRTLFQLWGDWFGWCAIALLVLVLVRLGVERRRTI